MLSYLMGRGVFGWQLAVAALRLNTKGEVMGLDITAYRRIAKLDAVFDSGGDPIDHKTRELLDYDFRAYINSDFPGRADDIEDRAVYSAGEWLGFRAGSYGWYNAWRDSLAELAGYPLGKYEQYGRMWDSYCVECWGGAQGPFAELINFSDCEGVIGAVISQKLAADFAQFQEKADAHPDERFREKYAEWRKAFEMAADGGAVDFH